MMGIILQRAKDVVISSLYNCVGSYFVNGRRWQLALTLTFKIGYPLQKVLLWPKVIITAKYAALVQQITIIALKL